MSEVTKGYTCYWRIENFTLRTSRPGLNLRSPDFHAACLNSHWFLKLFLFKRGYIGLYLFRKSNILPTNVSISISLLKKTGWEKVSENRSFEFKEVSVGSGEDRLVSWNNITIDEWTYLPYGSLTVSLNMCNDVLETKSAQWLIVSRMTSDCKDLKHLPVEKFRDLKPNNLLNFPASYKLETAETFKSNQSMETRGFNDIVELVKKMDLSFVTLRTKHKEFSVLKAVLCSKSPVFKAMFESRMIESDSDLVDIEDIDSDTMSLVIKYLHFQPIFWNLKLDVALTLLQWDEVIKLYYAADKYEIEELKKSCRHLLSTKMSNESVCDVFVFADMHQDEELLQIAQEHFSKNSKIILKSEEWKDFLLSNTKLASEVLCKLADKL